MKIPKGNRLRKILLDPLYWRASRREILPYLQSETVEEIVAATTRYRGSGFYKSIRAYQSLWEVTELSKLVQSTGPRVVVEIGTCRGGTLWIWCRSNRTAEKVVSIDLPDSDFGGGYDERRARLYELFVSDRPGTELFLLRGDSHEESTRKRLESILDGEAIDFLFIDADHTYEGVRDDFMTYSEMVRNDGIIALHDTMTRRDRHEAYRFWREVSSSSSWKHLDIIESPDREGNGIGVLFKWAVR